MVQRFAWFGAAVWLACCLFVFGPHAVVVVDAQQSYNPVGSGGPLWWVPANDSSYSRHHDRWFESPVEELNAGAATSFPPAGAVEADPWLGEVAGAPPNSACDFQDGTGLDTAGPPDADGNVPERWNDRTAAGGWGFAGLQSSVHVLEWWQGIRYAGFLTPAGAVRADLDPQVAGLYFPPGVVGRNVYRSDRFGFFSVFARDGSGADRPLPLGPRGVDWILPVRAEWRLWGSDAAEGFVMPCVGVSMVKMHGVPADMDGDRAFPGLPVGSDDADCWSSARPFILRANSEARCEPDLRVRRSATERFYAGFVDGVEYEVAGEDVAVRVPHDYGQPYAMTMYSGQAGIGRSTPPFLMARRGEVALFTAAELARAETGAVENFAALPSNWNHGFTTGADYPDRLDRFRSNQRVDPFGGDSYGAGEVDLYIAATGDADCLRMGTADWDAVVGAVDLECAIVVAGDEQRVRASRMTAQGNWASPGGAVAERTAEVGPLHAGRGPDGVNPEPRALAWRQGRGWVPTARQQDVRNGWSELGYTWFEHRSSTLGCLWLEYDVNDDPAAGLVADAQTLASYWERQVPFRQTAVERERARRAEDCADLPWHPDPQERQRRFAACESAGRAAVRRLQRRVDEALENAAGWMAIRDYRTQVLPEFVRAFEQVSASGLSYQEGRGVLIANGRSLGPGGNACVTAPDGGAGFDESVRPASVLAAAGGGSMWYGEPFDFAGAGGRGSYSQVAGNRGRTTGFSDAVRRPGTAYPPELTGGVDFSDVAGGGTVWRDFACPAEVEGFYGVGARAVGPQTVDHRVDPQAAWKSLDPEIDPTDPAARYGVGLPCVDAGDPLADAYNVRGRNRDFSVAGNRCFDPAGAGVYGVGGHSVYELEYAGDGPGTRDPGTVGLTEPAAYALVAGSEHLRLEPPTGFFHLQLGYRSLDLERDSIWSAYGAPERGWLVSGEEYAGTPPGWCPAGDCVGSPPVDSALLLHEGPVSAFGAIIPGGRGGCLLEFHNRSAAYARFGLWDLPYGSVFDSGQRLFCLLPVDVGPSGLCPGQSIP